MFISLQILKTRRFYLIKKSNFMWFHVVQVMLAVVVMLGLSTQLHAASNWVSLDDTGRLIYRHTQNGDRIADFSFAGYHGGGVTLPEVPQRYVVKPSGEDDTAAIQQAIDKVGNLPLIDRSRGAVVLASGTFHLNGTLRFDTSGVVLRGAGMQEQGTTLFLTGRPHLALAVAGNLKVAAVGKPTTVTDAYVASGVNSFRVADASGLQAGDTISISKPVTKNWLHRMGMDNLGDRNGKSEHWIEDNMTVRRRITAISGNLIELEVPLIDSYDAAWLGVNSVSISKVLLSGQLTEIGIELMRVVAPTQNIKLGDPEFDGIKMKNATDSWLKSVAFQDTTNSVSIDSGTERITVLSVDVINHVSIVGAAKPFDFSVNGTQILLDRCTGTGNNTFYFATQGGQQGPVVLLHSKFFGNGHIQPHQRWSTGLLVDNCEVLEGGIDFMNRGQMGSGHGWTMGWAVAWNNVAKSFNMNQPPGVVNWVIGNTGLLINPPMPVFDQSAPRLLPESTVESPGRAVRPRSLYLQQLKERMGEAALREIGYQ